MNAIMANPIKLKKCILAVNPKLHLNKGYSNCLRFFVFFCMSELLFESALCYEIEGKKK